MKSKVIVSLLLYPFIMFRQYRVLFARFHNHYSNARYESSYDGKQCLPSLSVYQNSFLISHGE